MAETPVLLREFALLVAIAVGTALLMHRLKLPVVAGLLLTGALAGPHALGLVKNSHDIEALAEAGVMLLLFTIGLEFTPQRLHRVGHFIVAGGLLQMGLTIAAVVGVALLAGESIQRGLVYGFVLALSSTAIVLRLLSERGELDALHGHLILGILIFQDLAIVPLVLIIPLLGGTGGSTGPVILLALLKAGAVIAGAILMGRYFLPRLFRWVDATRSRELFLMAVLAVCLGTAYASSAAGLSLALGAFIAGLVLAESDYALRAIGDLLPLRDILTSLFFISIGMLFSGTALIREPLFVLGLLGAIIVGKGFIATIAALLLKLPARLAWLTGVGLAQFGEFGFVLLGLARQHKLIGSGEFDTILTAGIMSMFLTPLFIALAPRIRVGEALLEPLAKWMGIEAIGATTLAAEKMTGHVVIVGFGPSGQMLARVLKRYDIPYLILDLNIRTVHEWRKKGEPIHYGDVKSHETMHHAGLDQAAALVVMVNDVPASELAIQAARHYRQDVPILVRSRYAKNREHFLQLGGTEIITEELEAGRAMVSATLSLLGIDRRTQVQNIYSDSAAAPVQSPRELPATEAPPDEPEPAG